MGSTLRSGKRLAAEPGSPATPLANSEPRAALGYCPLLGLPTELLELAALKSGSYKELASLSQTNTVLRALSQVGPAPPAIPACDHEPPGPACKPGRLLPQQRAFGPASSAPRTCTPCGQNNTETLWGPRPTDWRSPASGGRRSAAGACARRRCGCQHGSPHASRTPHLPCPQPLPRCVALAPQDCCLWRAEWERVYGPPGRLQEAAAK